MKAIFILTAGLIVLAGCRKDKDEAPPAKKTNTQLLTQKQWILSAAGFDDNKNGNVDETENTLTECQRDNIYTFNANGTGNISDNILVCNEHVNATFSWKLLNNDQEIEINSQPYVILHITEDNLLMAYRVPWLTVDFLVGYHH